MRSMLSFIGLFVLALTGVAWAGDEEEGLTLRIENEVKLSVPDDQVEATWEYLTKRYEGQNAADLGFGGTVKVTFGDEKFIDRYFDDFNLSLHKSQQGVRHRTRYIFNDPSNRKHGRQLLQLKLSGSAIGDTARNEIKFDVVHNDSPASKDDRHPLFGLIHPSERNRLKDELKNIGIDAAALRPMLDIEQRRRRVYISVDGKPFATITLDDVSSMKWMQTVKFTEIEMELNEIAYTEADQAGRARMEAINERMKADLMAKFPGIRQDQTPKYNKTFARFEDQFWMFPVMVRMGLPLEAVAGGTGLVGLVGAFVFLRRRKKD